MSNQDSSYQYDVDEFSQDVRRFRLISNRKLPQDVIETIYCEVEHLNESISSSCFKSEDVTKSAWTELNRSGYGKDKYFQGLECTTAFLGTDYGDSETEIAYDNDLMFYEEKE